MVKTDHRLHNLISYPEPGVFPCVASSNQCTNVKSLSMESTWLVLLLALVGSVCIDDIVVRVAVNVVAGIVLKGFGVGIKNDWHGRNVYRRMHNKAKTEQRMIGVAENASAIVVLASLVGVVSLRQVLSTVWCVSL